MTLNRIILSIATALTLLSCSNETSGGGSISTEKVEVVISAAQASTRTAIEDDLTTTRWCDDDKIALWATGADDGVARFSGEQFSLRYYGLSYSEAEFTSSISPMDESQEYLYKAFYPYPSSVSGTNITYTLASSQSGEFDGINDFRVADEVTGKALTESTIGGCNLSFRSLTHALRITIPEGENELGDDVGIAKLIVTLPFDAVGTMSMDMSNTSTAPTISSGAGRVITLDLSSAPLYAGDGRYVWLFFNPVSGVSGDITISAITDSSSNNTVTDIYTIPISNHTFEAGYVTPVNTRIEEPYTINFVEIFNEDGSSCLGETAIKMTLSTTDGSNLLNGSSSVILESNTGEFSFSFASSIYNLDSKTLAVTYESASAIVTGDNITIGTLDMNTMYSSVDYKLPYLLSQNFDNLNSDISSDDNNGTGIDLSDVSTSTDTVDLGDYGLTGWSAERFGGKKGDAIRICCRQQANYTYDGWIKSPALSMIKSGSEINIVIKYSYCGGLTEWYKSSGGGSSGTPYYRDPKGDTKYQGSSGGNWAGYASNYRTETCNITVDNSSTISWEADCDKDYAWLGTQNGNYWLYLDNIEVSIVQ